MSICDTTLKRNVFETSRSCYEWYSGPNLRIDITTISILGTKFRPYLIAILVLVWAFDIWQQGLLKRHGSARHWRWYGAAIGMTCSLAFKNKWALDFAFTAFAVTWNRLPDSPTNDAASLPSFDKFLKSLSNANLPEPSPTEASKDEANDTPEGPDCIVCWSSSDPPRVLPCTHLICADCLSGIKSSTQNHCPMCRTPLFTRSNTNTIRLYRAIASIWNADISVRLLAVALHIYKAEGFTRDLIFDAVWVFWEGFYTLWMQKMIREGGGEWWRLPTFSRLDGASFWRRPGVGVLLVGFTLLFKIHEIGGLDEKMVFSEVY